MADNVTLNIPDTSGAVIATDEVGAAQHQLIKIEFGVDGVATMVSASDPLPVTAASLPLPSGAATAANQQTDALTDTELRATPVPVSATNLDIRDLTSASDSILMYGSDDGGTTKRVIKTDSAGVITVLPIVAGTTTGTIDADEEAITITLTANVATVGVYVSGTYTGQLEFESTIDNTNWFAHDVQSGVGNFVNATTGTGNFIAQIGGFLKFRVRASFFSSGAAIVTLIDSLGAHIVNIAPGDAVIGHVIVDSISATDLDVRNLVFATDKVDASGTTLGANSGVDIGDVTINNATIAVTQSGTWDEVGINDSGNSITVDAPIGTPVNVQVGNGTLAAGVIDETGASAVDALAVGGGTAHDAVDSGNPVKVGGKALDLGATPTAVAANDRTNAAFMRNGVQFVLGGHPNILSQNVQITDADGAQTDLSLVGTIAAGTSVVVTKCSVMADKANTVDVSVRIGFGTANTPAADAAGIILFHPGIAAGSGVVEGSGGGIIGIGASDQELRMTCEDPVTGSISVIITYFTIAIG